MGSLKITPVFIISFETKRCIETAFKACTELNLTPQYILTHDVYPEYTRSLFGFDRVENLYDLFQKKQESKFITTEEANSQSFEALAVWNSDFNNLLTIFQRNNIDSLNYLEARRYILKMLSIVCALFNKYNPQIVMFFSLPHEFFEYIFYSVAKQKKIKFVYDVFAFFPLLTILTNKNIDEFNIKDFAENTNHIQSSYIEEYIKYATTKLPADPAKNIRLALHRGLYSKKNIILEKAKLYTIFALYLLTRSQCGKVANIIIKLFKKTTFGKYIKFESTRFSKNTPREIIENIKLADVFIQYTNLTKHNANIDFTKEKYIFVPMAFQPESTTCPMGGEHFWDFFTIVKSLAGTLPKSIKIFVKEHPHQFPIGSLLLGSRCLRFRDKNYYQDLLNIDERIVLLPLETPSLYLIEGSIAVATSTGSAGFEALIHNKRSIIFGNTYYKNLPGVFNINTKNDLQNAIESILNNNSFASDIDLIKSEMQKTFQISYLAEDGFSNVYLKGATTQNLPQMSVEVSYKIYINQLKKML